MAPTLCVILLVRTISPQVLGWRWHWAWELVDLEARSSSVSGGGSESSPDGVELRGGSGAMSSLKQLLSRDAWVRDSDCMTYN